MFEFKDYMKKIYYFIFVYSVLLLTFNSLESQFNDTNLNEDLDSFSYKSNSLFKSNDSKISSDSIFNLSIKDSFQLFDVEVGSFVDITWGDNYLWILKPSDYLHDNIFKVDPFNGTIKGRYHIHFPKSYWSLGLVFDSNSLGGPFLWCPITKQSIVGGYYDTGILFKLRVSDMSIIDSIFLPDNSPSGIALYNDLLWITGQDNNIMYIYDINSGEFIPLFNIKDATYGESICFDNNNALILWMMEIDFSNEIYGEKTIIHKVNPSTGKILKTFKAPWLFPSSLCCENESSGGPYLWISDIATNKFYKVKEPNISSVLDDLKKINFSKIDVAPNPFSNKTKISFNLEEPSYTKITIYNSLGYVLDVLTDEYLSEGTHEFTFDGSALASGTYYYVLQANGKVETGQLVMIK